MKSPVSEARGTLPAREQEGVRSQGPGVGSTGGGSTAGGLKERPKAKRTKTPDEEDGGNPARNRSDTRGRQLVGAEADNGGNCGQMAG